jgi:hypothetical protein
LLPTVEPGTLVPGVATPDGLPNAPPGENGAGRVVAGSTVVWFVPLALPLVLPAPLGVACSVEPKVALLLVSATPGLLLLVVVVVPDVVPDVAALSLLVVAVQLLPPVPVQPPTWAALVRPEDVPVVVVELPVVDELEAVVPGTIRSVPPVVCANTVLPERAIATAAAR